MKQTYTFKLHFLFIFLTAFCMSNISAKSAVLGNDEILETIDQVNAISATVSGSTSVCMNTTPNPVVTFSANGGVAPYTFNYQLNGVSQTALVSSATANTVQLTVPTTVAGEYNYTLTSIKDQSGFTLAATGNATVSVISLPDLTINSSAELSVLNGKSYYKVCSNTLADLTFTNTSSTQSINSNYTIDWGDGTPSFTASEWSSVNHTYAIGFWTMKYTITNKIGCSVSKQFDIYVGSNPAVSLGSPGNTDNCSNVPLTFPITGTENNPPSTVYTVSFNDGTPSQVFNHPPPAEITHTFVKTSCGVTSYNGTTPYPNSFSASIVASNMCGVSAVNVVPIYISTSPVVNFNLPAVSAPTNKAVYFTNTTTGYVNVGANCAVVPKLVWIITPSTGFTLSSGSLGNDFGQDNSNLWTKGSDVISPVFKVPGIYKIKLRVDTKRCGNDQIEKTICIEAPLNPQFSLQTNGQCTPVEVVATNSTDLTKTCTSTTKWTVTYLAENCGSAPAVWSFANGTTQQSANPVFNFVTPGTYKIALSMTNTAGTFTTEQSVVVKRPPTATIQKIADNCGTATIKPVAVVNSCTPQSNALSYKWDFPGGSPATASTLDPGVITYNSVGSYTAYLTVTNECGSTTATSNTFNVNPLPEVNETVGELVNNGELTKEIVFQGTTGASFEWTNNNPAIGLAGSGTGNIKPFVAINWGNTVLTATIKVTPKNPLTGCVGTSKSFSIQVNPNGVVNPIESQVVNNGQPVRKVEFSTTLTGGTTSYNWVNSSPEIGLPASGSGNISSFVAQNTSGKPIEATITVTPVFEYGGERSVGAPKAFTITVNPMAQVNSLNNIELCNGLNIPEITFSTKNLSEFTTYNWTNDNTGIGLAASGTSNTLNFVVVNNTANQQVAHITVVPTFTYKGISNVGPAEHFTISVNPGAVITNQPASSFICPGGDVTPLKVAYKDGVGTPTYQWYSNRIKSTSGATLIQGATGDTYIPNVTSSGITYYFCVVSLPEGICSDITTQIATVSVSEAATISQQPEKLQNICVGGTVSIPLSIKYANGYGTPSYQWYLNSVNSNYGGTAIVGATDSTYIPSVFNKVGEYYYYVELKLAGGGCGSTFSQVAEVNVVSDPVVTVQPVASQTICKDVVPTDLIVTANGGLGAYSYQWFENTVNNNISGTKIVGGVNNKLTPKTSLTGTTYYYCEISQPNGVSCKVTSETAEVIVNPNPVITSQALSSIVCYGDSATELSVKYSYGVGTPAYQWYSGSTNLVGYGTLIPGAISSKYRPESTKLGTTYYYCVLTFQDGGCLPISSAISSVTVNPVPKISAKKVQICNGSTFSMTPAEANGDVVPAGTNYIWSSPFIARANSINGYTAQPTPVSEISQRLFNHTDSVITVVYRITPVTNSCVGQDFTVEVKVLPTIKPNAVVKDVSCFGADNGSIQTNITGGIPFNTTLGYDIQWTGPNGFTAASKDIAGLAPGEYQVTITDAGGCPVTAKYTVKEPTQIHINTDIKRNLNCAGDNTGKIDVTVTGGVPPYNYSWKKDGAYFANTEDIANLQHGVYVLNVTDAYGCGLETEFYSITEPAAIDIKLIGKSDILCSGDSTGAINVEVKGGTPFEKTSGEFDYNYTWSGPKGFTSTDKNLKHLTEGTYNLTVTDAFGCNQTVSVQLNQPNKLIVRTEVSAVTCFKSNNASIALKIEGGTSPYKIQWSNSGTGLIQTNLAPGTYTAIVADANECQQTVVVNIAEANFSIYPEVKNVSCFGGNDGSIKLNITGGVQPVSFVWSDNPTAGAVRNGLSPGIYTVTLHDGAPCNVSESFLISEPEQIRVVGQVINAFECGNQNSGSINIKVTGGTAPYSYQWSNGSKTQNISNLSSGTYYVIVTDSRGCSGNGKFEIQRQMPLSVSVTSTLEFDCAAKKLIKTYSPHVEGGFAPYRYNWSMGSVSGRNNEIMRTSQSSLIDLQVTDSLGCTASYKFNVDVPNIGISYNLVDCSRFYYKFYAIKADVETNDMTYSWNFGDGETSTLRNPIHTFAHAGNFNVTLIISTSAGSAVYEQIIYIDPQSKIKLDREPKLCINDSVVLHATGADNYKWSDGTVGDSIKIKHVGEYMVIGTSANGCVDTLTFTATNYDLFNYTIQSDSDNVAAGGFPLRMWSNKIPFSQYYWDFGDGSTAQGDEVTHTFNAKDDGFYDIKLMVVNPNGCLEYATKRIWVTVPVLPNTFSPNGDGVNERFLENWNIKVYSRNGAVLYEGKNGWDGKYKGQAVSNGIYFFVLYYPAESGTKTSSGYVRVIR